ncbi:hypothetical protein C6P45_000144 [Maudiozyma exigua]|uniref:Uncharacterized protein n=1 Tax=Maudiozyma exigua TaxID=34358 RepID=A0A9P7BDJ9_MAUEX|nr:hypothetical protein C6P45_000144 [Kazachstania exigua]
MKFSKIATAASSLVLLNVSTTNAMNGIHRPTYNGQFNDSITNLTAFINDNYNEVLAKNCIMSICNLTESINKKYRKRAEVQFILIKLLGHKLTHMVEDTQSEDVTAFESINCDQVIGALEYANRFAPSDLYKQAAKHLTRISKREMKKLLTLLKSGTNHSEEHISKEVDSLTRSSLTEAQLIKRAGRFPRTELFLKHLTIMLVIAAALMDACGNVSLALCQTLLVFSFLTLAYWLVEISRVLFGMDNLSVTDILPF